jgi:hypothetical protein
VAGVYRSTQASGVDTLSRYDPNTLAFLESITDVTSPVVVDGKLWAVGTGSRAGALLRLNIDDVTDVLDTVPVPGLTEWTPSYLPIVAASSGAAFVETTQQPDPDEIDIRVRCRRQQWIENRNAFLVSRGGPSIGAIDPYLVRLTNGTFTWGIKSGGTVYTATETTANLGCVDGDWRWLRFRYEVGVLRFYYSTDGINWTLQKSTSVAGGALDTGGASTEFVVGNNTGSDVGWDGDVSDVYAYDENSALIHDLALDDLTTPVSGSNTWTAGTTGEVWTAGAAINPAGTGYAYTLCGDGDSLLLASRNTGFDVGLKDRLRDVEILQRRDATTGALIWQVDGYECGFSPQASLDDGAYVYVGNKRVISGGYKAVVARLDRNDGSFIDEIQLAGTQNVVERMIRIGSVLFLPTEDGITEVDFGTTSSALIVSAAATNDIDTDATDLYQVESFALAGEINKYQSDGTFLATRNLDADNAGLVRYDTNVFTTGRATAAGLTFVSSSLGSSTTVVLANNDALTGFAVLYQNPPTPGPRGLGGWGVGETKDEQW